MPHAQRKVSKSVKKYVKSQITRALEPKYHVVDGTTAAAITTTATLTLLSAVPEGTGEEQRIGIEIRPERLELRYILKSNTNTKNVQVRMMILRTRVQGTPAAGDVLIDTSALGIAISPLDPWIKEQEVLYDRVHNLFDVLNAETRQSISKKVIGKRKMPAKITFDIAATTADRNQLWLLAISNTVANDPTISFMSIMKYRDG